MGVSNLVLTGPTSFTIKDINGITIGGEIPVTNALTLGVNYVKVDYKGTNGGSSDLGKMAFSGRYALSKNTFLYAGAYQATGALKDYISQKTVFQGGVRTSF